MALSTRSRNRLVEGADRLDVGLDPSQIEQFGAYTALLQLWGRKINLTSRRTEDEIVIYHFLDSLAGLQVLDQGGVRLADIGSGAGFPGLPLKIAAPALSLSLMESSHKKVSFCREVVRTLGLEGVTFLEERAEEAVRAGRYLQSFDWIVTRAFRAGAETLRLVHPFLAPKGSCCLYKGDPGREEMEALVEEAARLDLHLQDHPVRIPFLEASRRLLVIGPAPSDIMPPGDG